MNRPSVIFAAVATSFLVAIAIAEELPRRTTQQTIGFPPGYKTVMVIAELDPGQCTGRHTHPGVESAFVLEGKAVAKVDGKPDLNVAAGQPLLFAPGAIHNICNLSGRPFKALAHYIVDNDKPLASPAP